MWTPFRSDGRQQGEDGRTKDWGRGSTGDGKRVKRRKETEQNRKERRGFLHPVMSDGFRFCQRRQRKRREE